METKLEPESESEAKPKYRKFSLKSCEELLNKIANEEKNKNEELLINNFKYQNPSSLLKDLIKADKNKKYKIKYLIINKLIKLVKILA